MDDELNADLQSSTIEDPDQYLSDFYKNHPCASNTPYDYSSAVKIEDEIEDEEEVEYVEVKPKEMGDFVPPSHRDDAPLASILNPALDCVDPRRFFPDYESNAILRFSRIFSYNIKSSSKADIWWPSRTFHKKPLSEEEKQQNDNSSEKKKLKLNLAPSPAPEDLENHQEALLLSVNGVCDIGKREPSKLNDELSEEAIPPWRNGPAKIWYDKMNVSSSNSHFDYGFKLRKQKSAPDKPESDTPIEPLAPETFLPVNLIRWEDDVIYDGEDVRDQVLEELRSGQQPACGWIPTQNTRTYESFIQHMRNRTFEQMFSRRNSSQNLFGLPDIEIPTEPTATHSIFPMENQDLLDSKWEDEIILDDQQMNKIPEPKVLTLDYNDDPLIFGMPQDRKGDDLDSQPNKAFDRKEHQFTKKSKMILGQVQQRQKQEEEEQMETSMAQLTDKDPFNMSNDDYYLPKTTNKSGSAGNSMLIQHSIPSQNIHRTFFPTHLFPNKLRLWHRLPLSKKYFRTVSVKFSHIQILTRYIKRMEEEREKKKQAEGGGDIFFMRKLVDLSGRDGDLVIMEYSEEHPPLLSQPGMASKIKNYYKRKAGKDVEPDFDYGEMAFSHNVPFLGQLQPGQAMQSVENNLFRAPIYRHTVRNTDFLLIRNKGDWSLRRVPTIYLVGQECPLYEVPSPNSKRATAFVRDFLLAFIYRLFWASEFRPRRLKMEDIKAAFPHYAESSVRKRLKQCSDFKRLKQGSDSKHTFPGPDQNFWVLRPEFRLPSKEEVLAMVTPEMCCAQYSMLAAEQRLKDAGYGERYFFTPENEDDSDDGVTIEDEIKCAPWNTTRAFLSSMRGKCLLDQTGIADPTGCGQGFSYVRVSQKPQKEDTPAVPKRLVTGTNADLRKLPLKEAKEICREYGVREEEIAALSRWEIIDVIRTLSTQAAKAKADSSGGELSGMARFARGNIRFNFADMQEKYKKHCQHIFDLQNQTLANPENLSTDEGSSGEDSDNEEWSSQLEKMLQSSKNKNISSSDRARMEFENEEKERQDLKRMIHGDASKTEKKEVSAEEKKNVSKIGEDISQSASKISGITANEKLKIYRTSKNNDGTLSTRMEIVTRPQLIEAYARIRTTKDDTFIQVYAQMDEQYKEERRKEKRRLQDQLRRIRRNEMKAKTGTAKVEKKPTPVKPNVLKMKCSACHATGHMKTNKNCPFYGKEGLGTPTKEGLTDDENSQPAPSEVVAVEGTKVKISKKYLTGLSEKKKLARTPSDRFRTESTCSDSTDVAMKDPDDSMDSEQNLNRSQRMSTAGGLRRRISMFNDEDYLQGPVKSVQRIRADPRVTMATLLMEIVNEMKLIEGSDYLLKPVNSKQVRDYYDIITNPMNIEMIKQKLTKNEYSLRKDFLCDVKLMLDNSLKYNGDNHVITDVARKMFELAGKRILEKEDQLIKLEKSINPLLDDNDRVGFGYILSEIIQKCKNIPRSVAFHNKVDSKKVPLYYDKVKNPMDLGTIENKVKAHEFTTINQFRQDIQQIVTNSEIFNGPQSAYTLKAYEILELANTHLAEQAAQLTELEANINGGNIPDDQIEETDTMDEEENEGSQGILQDDLALSGNEVEDEDDNLEGWEGLLQSDMFTNGQLRNDLALTDSEDEESVDALKRPSSEDNLMGSF